MRNANTSNIAITNGNITAITPIVDSDNVPASRLSITRQGLIRYGIFTHNQALYATTSTNEAEPKYGQYLARLSRFSTNFFSADERVISFPLRSNEAVEKPKILNLDTTQQIICNSYIYWYIWLNHKP